ncbi:MAG TPA: hypothetical protein VMA72_03690 [Streptosporangiaceae bacterium]|nr:hypothetical protein [Streptosporangiaceae bacterium]
MLSSTTWLGGDEGQGQIVMPFYLVCDVSDSMSGEIAALHDAITTLRNAIRGEPVVDDVARICVMTFSDIARVALPLARMSESEIPRLAHENKTLYGEAFRKLAHEVAEDYKMLRSKGCRIYRPCAYFLTDGEPTDRNWRQTFAETLTGDSMARLGIPTYPIFVPFGFREARVQTLQRLAYPRYRSKWYHARSASIEDALKGLMDIIVNSVVTSGSSRTSGSEDDVIVLPDPEPGSGVIADVADFDDDFGADNDFAAYDDPNF